MKAGVPAVPGPYDDLKKIVPVARLCLVPIPVPGSITELTGPMNMKK